MQKVYNMNDIREVSFLTILPNYTSLKKFQSIPKFNYQPFVEEPWLKCLLFVAD